MLELLIWLFKPSCQKRAWNDHHKAECKIFASHKAKDVFLYATLRLLAKKRLGSMDDKDWAMVKSLQSREEDYWRSGEALQKTISTATSDILKWTDWDERIDTVRELYCQVTLRCIESARNADANRDTG